VTPENIVGGIEVLGFDSRPGVLEDRVHLVKLLKPKARDCEHEPCSFDAAE
jgi:hypothetical protein